MQHQLEICVDSLESIEAAIKGGADRLELCSALSLGGLTPSLGLLQCAKEAIHKAQRHIPVYCMIRCRNGDFVYSEHEMKVMIADLLALRSGNADGFVFGALDQFGYVHAEYCRHIRIAAGDKLPLTFHRAIDLCADWRRSLLTIRNCGFNMILSSGQCETAEEATSVLRNMQLEAPNGLQIMVGSGVRPENIERLAAEIPVSQWHSSASKIVLSNCKCLWGDCNDSRRQTDSQTVFAMKNTLRKLSAPIDK